MTKYDTVYWWQGGREVGNWIETQTQGTGLDEVREHCRRGGYVAHLGHTDIGPPEGPPSDAEFKALGL